MQVFKKFFRVALAVKSRLIVAVCIGIFMIIFLTGQSDTSTTVKFESTSLNIAVIDEDDSEISRGIVDYLKSIHNVDETKHREDLYKDRLFYQDIVSKVVINKGSGENILNGKDANITNLYNESTPLGLFVNNQINEYLSIVQKKINEGKDVKVALDEAKKAMDSTNFVNIKEEKTDAEGFAISFNFLPYVVMITLFSSVLYAMLAFNEKEVKNRTLVSAITPIERGLGLVMGCICLSTLIYIVLLVTSVYFGYKQIPSTRALILEVINLFIYTIVCNMVIFLVTVCSGKLNDAVMVIANGISLTFAFLGGSFVPAEYLSESVKRVGRFTPNYWYSSAIDRIVDGAPISSVAQAYLMQIAIGLAFLGISLAVLKIKNDRSLN
ncbi:ABC-2 family transporter protein [Eubacterium uniforme]|uniref:ABC-2 family transporter protein n=1 Tax=Eubacterium uniforme TaxID=39495 RepID=A0A1T4W0I5_9FIRM|nr:ABC transporter permease [Eubacterium uniforme]SKA70733.1 ABC-2 family transporter protein [Eubacterium uniforme]